MQHDNKSVIFYRLFSSRLTAIISTSLVLLLIGLVTLTHFSAKRLTEYIREHVGFVVELERDIKPNELRELARKVEKIKEVKQVNIITREEALALLKEELGEDPSEFLGYNPLSPSFEVLLEGEAMEQEQLTKVQMLVKGMSGVRSLSFRKDLVESINDNINRFRVILSTLVMALLFISYVLIGNTIRLTIYSQRFLIQTMRLVGASSGFIRKPFIKSSFTNGVIAALLASAMLGGLMFYVSGQYTNFLSFIQLELALKTFGAMILAGIAISCTSTYFAVNKYIDIEKDKLFYM